MMILKQAEQYAWHIEGLDWHSQAEFPEDPTGDEPFRMKDHVPADYGWLSTGRDTPHGHLIPQIDDSHSKKWYHVSPHAMTPGTRITPGGGSSPDDTFYGHDNWNRRNQVFMAPNLDQAKWWRDNWAGAASHIYEVHPGDRPQAWNLNGGQGYVAPHAVVKRQVA